jgi:hypothetical protein
VDLAESSLQAFATRAGITQSNALFASIVRSSPQKAAHPRLRHLLEARLSQLPLHRNEAILKAAAEDLSASSRCASARKQ